MSTTTTPEPDTVKEAHEPGPWILGGCSGRMITTPSGYTGDGFIADVDTLANARLIAAAPDLLDAVKNFVADHRIRYGLKACPCNVCRMGNAAIAKATA